MAARAGDASPLSVSELGIHVSRTAALASSISKYTYQSGAVKPDAVKVPTHMQRSKRNDKVRTVDLLEMPGHLIRRLQQIAVEKFQSALEQAGYDLTPVQFAALVTIEGHPGLAQATLANLIAYDRATIGGVVDRLIQKGHLQRKVSNKDRRARELKLTAFGRSTLRKATPLVIEVQRIILSGLDTPEQRAFMKLLRKLTAATDDRTRPRWTADVAD